MKLYYQGQDITDRLDIAGCVFTNTAAGVSSVDIELEHPAEWYGWNPKQDETIRATADGLDTGTMYVDMILPADRRFRIVAIAAPKAARSRRWQSWEQQGFAAVAGDVAAQAGLGLALHGVSGGGYAWMVRRNESCLEFLARLGALEGAALKCADGKAAFIGYAYAKGLPPAYRVSIDTLTEEAWLHLLDGEKASSMSIGCKKGPATATVTAQGGSMAESGCEFADSIGTAKRWAAGSLTARNRDGEILHFACELNGDLVAMARVDVDGLEKLTGTWLVREARHDLILGSTECDLMR